LFVVSWLCVSLQPCLMAMEPGADAPMAMASGHSAHSSHAVDEASPDADADCGHCPPAACEVAMSCDVKMSSECQPDVQCSLDSRRAKLILEDVQYDLQPDIAATIAATTFAGHEIVPPGVRVTAYVPGLQPPLNLLNCIYLI
jgi:hypothetical protein